MLAQWPVTYGVTYGEERRAKRVIAVTDTKREGRHNHTKLKLNSEGRHHVAKLKFSCQAVPDQYNKPQRTRSHHKEHHHTTTITNTSESKSTTWEAAQAMGQQHTTANHDKPLRPAQNTSKHKTTPQSTANRKELSHKSSKEDRTQTTIILTEPQQDLACVANHAKLCTLTTGPMWLGNIFPNHVPALTISSSTAVLSTCSHVVRAS